VEGNWLCEQWTAKAYYLGLGLANLINLFVPDVIVLGGSVMKSAALFLDGIRKVIRQGLPIRFPYEKTELALASLGEGRQSHRCGRGSGISASGRESADLPD